jgi:hypothetical protein
MRDRRAAGGCKNSGADLEKRAFAGAVFAYDTKSFAALDLETNVTQSPEFLVKPACLKRGEFLQSVARRGVD